MGDNSFVVEKAKTARAGCKECKQKVCHRCCVVCAVFRCLILVLVVRAREPSHVSVIPNNVVF